VSKTAKPNIVTYSLRRGFLLSAAAVVFVLIVTTVAFAFGSAPITVAVAGGILYVVIVLVGSFKMRAQLKRKLQGESKSQQPRA
jgi:uncharacterized membrane protein